MPERSATTTSAKKPPISQFEPTADSRKSVQQPADMMEVIRARAYQLYELRGREDGHAEEDWLQAEIEVLASHSQSAAA